MNVSPLTSAVAIARALGHPARLRTVAVLTGGDLCVCQITAMLALAPSTVSALLRELRHAGLITEHKDGRWVYVSLADDATIRPWIDNAVSAVRTDPTFTSDRRTVNELRKLSLEELRSLCSHQTRTHRTPHGSGKSAETAPKPRHPR